MVQLFSTFQILVEVSVLLVQPVFCTLFFDSVNSGPTLLHPTALSKLYLKCSSHDKQLSSHCTFPRWPCLFTQSQVLASGANKENQSFQDFLSFIYFFSRLVKTFQGWEYGRHRGHLRFLWTVHKIQRITTWLQDFCSAKNEDFQQVLISCYLLKKKRSERSIDTARTGRFSRLWRLWCCEKGEQGNWWGTRGW